MQEIKIHASILQTIIACLKSIFEEQKVADKEVGFILKQNKNFGARDRSMIAESVYDIVRWKLKYSHQLGVYHPAYTKYAHLVLMSLLNRKYKIKNPEIFEVTEKEIQELENVITLPVSENHITQSYPEAFYNFCLEHIGEQWHAIAVALNNKPTIYIRVNTLKTTTADFIDLLKKEAIDYEPTQLENCIKILSKNNLKNSIYYKQGLFEFQDIGSQTIGLFLMNAIQNIKQIHPITILDLCAGAGGKTLQISALLKNNGKIYATDYQASRVKNLALRAQQAGCKNIEIIDFNEAKKLKNIDCILIDAPCSGTGTFKRQADLKYKINSEKVNEYSAIQRSLLQEYKNCLHKNGKIIYATCSILPQENEQTIQFFLEQNTTFSIEKTQQLLPTTYDGDGFFMACLKRTY